MNKTGLSVSLARSCTGRPADDEDLGGQGLLDEDGEEGGVGLGEARARPGTGAAAV